jgi:alpha-L-rhamnosidase
MGEMLDKDGEFTQANFQLQTPVKEAGIIKELMLISGQGSKLKTPLQPTPKQEIIFTCGGGMDSYKTAFSVFGFRYVLVETDIEINPADFKAIAVYSAMERTGYFNCSNTKINRLLENTLWSMKGNFLDIPTDCPTRERLGWTGDAQVFFNTGAYLMNTAPLFRKWLGDLRDTQFKTGKPLAVAPYNGNLVMYKTSGGSVGWGDTLVLIPYRYWKRYGDADLLRDFYPAMKQYALYMIKKTGHKKAKAAKSNPYNKYVYEKGFHFGEWLEPEEFKEVIAPGVDVTQFVRIEEATAYLCYVMRHMEEIAGRLGKTDDAALFKEYAEGAKNAYNYLFPAIDTDRQAKLVRPLALGLLEGEKKLAVQKRLATAVENRRYKIGTGFLSTPFVLPVLSEAGFSGLAYKMLENEDIPGWLAEVNAGATTIWEDWEGTVSLNHYANGAVCEWLFDTVGGIRVAGENRFIIAPIPGGALTYADVEYASLYGTIHSKWERTEAGICFTVLIPPNTSAEVVLPNGKTHTVGSGTYTYTVEVKDDK